MAVCHRSLAKPSQFWFQMWTFEGLLLPAWEILLNEWWQLRNLQIKTMWDRSRERIIESQRTEKKSIERETKSPRKRLQQETQTILKSVLSELLFSYYYTTWMNIFSACQETHCEGFFSWMSLLCLLFNSLHRRWQLPPRCHRSGLNLCLRERWQHRFNTAFLSIMLSICFLFPLRLSEGGVCFGSAAAARGTRAHTQIIQT